VPICCRWSWIKPAMAGFSFHGLPQRTHRFFFAAELGQVGQGLIPPWRIFALCLHGDFRGEGSPRECNERHADDQRSHNKKQRPSDRMQATITAAKKAGWGIRHWFAPAVTRAIAGSAVRFSPLTDGRKISSWRGLYAPAGEYVVTRAKLPPAHRMIRRRYRRTAPRFSR
jgi:hypothetical protein